MKPLSRFMNAVLTLGVFCNVAAAEGRSLIEVATDENSYEGRLVAMDHSNCWMVARDGRLKELQVKQLKSFKRLKTKFEPYSSMDMKTRLREEFGREFEIVQSGVYMVVARKGRGKEFANILNDVYGIVQREFRTREFKVEPPEFPLVAIVFQTRGQYVEYATNEGTRGISAALGYFKRESNRIALYEDRRVTRNPKQPRRKRLASETQTIGPLNIRAAQSVFPAIESNLRDTLIHEAVHQVAFNLKIHSRIGNDPRWVIEGLATLFEASGVRDRASRYDFNTRVNRERYVTFGNFVKQRRKPKSLRKFVGSDDLFNKRLLDGYAQAWALSFYLFETRGVDYANFMKSIATRNVLKDYTAEDRLKHFEAAFGDVDELEIDFLRYIDRIKL
jgi:hypothetical protein